MAICGHRRRGGTTFRSHIWAMGCQGATDSDEAENAIITYSVKENVAFYVHPNIGSLYINLNAKMTEYVTVIASDGVHSSFLNISLKSLKSDNMVALYVTDAVIEDVEHIVAEIQKNLTTCIIGYIGAGVINNFNINSNIKKAKNKGTRNIMIQILIYGLDQQTHIPLSHTNLISVLNDYGVSNFAHIMEISALGDAEESNVLLITTITLGACLGILIIGAATYFTRQRLCK
ncbi:uncharacterized protein LOC122503477 [Leptopilina heterotoma]|uniref:uncharacterized protein LOC122503477 n=1 Tax=Leptopilina heterotoma TaxID=63436 RepID=UPI001CA93877|nr:uncharacterized protein LOC122503477 [Leptopilina heterotoma]